MLFSPSERHGWPSFFPFFSFFFCLKNSFFIGRKENRSTTTSSFGRDRDESLTRYPWRRSTPRGHAPRRLFSFPSRVFVVGKRKRFNLKKNAWNVHRSRWTSANNFHWPSISATSNEIRGSRPRNWEPLPPARDPPRGS